MLRRGIVVLVVALAAILMASGASSIPITNPSFEDDVLADGGFTGVANGWVVSNPSFAGTFNPSAGEYTDPVPDGDNVAVIGNGGASAAMISQALGVNAIAGVKYVLSAEVGNRNTNTFPSAWEIQLLIDGVVKQSDTLAPALGAFETVMLMYTAVGADDGKELSIAITADDGQVAIDLVNLVPEPSTAVLTGLGVLLLGLRRRG